MSKPVLDDEWVSPDSAFGSAEDLVKGLFDLAKKSPGHIEKPTPAVVKKAPLLVIGNPLSPKNLQNYARYLTVQLQLELAQKVFLLALPVLKTNLNPSRRA